MALSDQNYGFQWQSPLDEHISVTGTGFQDRLPDMSIPALWDRDFPTYLGLPEDPCVIDLRRW